MLGFYCVNDNKKINVIILQTVHCIFYYNNPILNVNPKIQARKRLIIYNTTNGIARLKKHVNLDHSNILKKFEEKLIVLWGKMKDNLPKKNQTFLLTPYLVQKRWCATKAKFGRFGSFNCQKPSFFTICRK